MQVEQAKLAMAKKDWPAAIDLWRLVLDSSSGTAAVGVYVQLARVYQRVNAYPEAERVLQDGLALYPADPALLDEYGKLAQLSGNWNEAVQLWNEVLAQEKAKNSARVYMQLARVHMSCGLYQRAVETLMEAALRFPDDSRLRRELKSSQQLAAENGSVDETENQRVASRLEPTDDESLAAMVRQAFGEDVQVFESSSIEKGLSNQGVFLHKTRSQALHENGVSLPDSRLWIVEKHTDSGHEVEFAKGLQKQHAQGVCVEPLPKVYAVQGGGKRSVIYMEYIPGVGRRPELSDAVVSAIVDAVVVLNQFSKCDRVSPSELLGYWFRSRNNGEKLEALCGLMGVPPEAFAGLESMARHLDQSKVVYSHNDIYWSNMALGWSSGKLQCRLIDFGLVKPNIVGADFHHFARVSVGDDTLDA